MPGEATAEAEVVEKLRTFVAARYLPRRKRALGADEPLFSSGTIDSVGLVDLTTFIETDLGVMLTPDEFGEGRADTVRQIVALVMERR
jgi:acyl carrier protein